MDGKPSSTKKTQAPPTPYAQEALAGLGVRGALRNVFARVPDELELEHRRVAKLQERRAPHSIWAKHGVGD